MSEKRKQLTPEELAVIRSRYGVELTDDPSRGLDPEEMDRLEASALRKLRHMTLESLQQWQQAV